LKAKLWKIITILSKKHQRLGIDYSGAPSLLNEIIVDWLLAAALFTDEMVKDLGEIEYCKFVEGCSIPLLKRT
jgi:hypothetical protein